MALSVDRHHDAGRSSTASAGFLGRREAEHNLLFGILDSLRRDASISDGPPILAEVREGDEIVAVAIRTPPRNLVLSECDVPAAIDALVDDLVAAGDALPGALGPVEAIRRFAERWTAAHGPAPSPAALRAGVPAHAGDPAAATAGRDAPRRRRRLPAARRLAARVHG